MQGDALCILNTFVEEIFRICDVHKSIPDVQEMLKNQLEKNEEHCSHFSADTKNIMVKFETIKKDLNILWFDKFIFECPWGCFYSYCNFFFQSDDAKYWIVNSSNEENHFEETLYFPRSFSSHIDTVIPCEKLQRISIVSEIYIFKK